jgi:2-C-methyl-D-erythritol 2,4-cyclodiphosphate synthase
MALENSQHPYRIDERRAYRIGYGEDAHRLEAGRPLILAGITVPDSPLGAIAHSDGDAILHAVSDALLSSLALGDIGKLYPDTDPQWQGLDSGVILRDVLERMRSAGLDIVNLAVVVTLDRPKLGPLREAMAANLSGLMGLEAGNVGITFKTSEGLAPAHVQTRATVLLRVI